jgi:hypothetical protein
MKVARQIQMFLDCFQGQHKQALLERLWDQEFFVISLVITITLEMG